MLKHRTIPEFKPALLRVNMYSYILITVLNAHPTVEIHKLQTIILYNAASITNQYDFVDIISNNYSRVYAILFRVLCLHLNKTPRIKRIGKHFSSIEKSLQPVMFKLPDTKSMYYVCGSQTVD
jgi:hypothetical protein